MEGTPLFLVQDALHAVALQGSAGVHLDALWELLPRIGADEAVRAFVWEHLRSHPHLGVALVDDVSSVAQTESQVRQLPVADAGNVYITASESLREHVYDPNRDGESTTAEQVKVIDALAQFGSRGVLQSMLTRVVGVWPLDRAYPACDALALPARAIAFAAALATPCLLSTGVPANKLAYTLFQLESDHAIHREPVYVDVYPGRGGHGHYKNVAPMTRTNLVTLSALRAPPVGIDLSQYSGHEVREATLLEQMVRVLAASPMAMLPIYRVRQELEITHSGGNKAVWGRLKSRALQEGIIEEVRFKVHKAAGSDSAAAFGTTAHQAVRQGIRLVRRWAAASDGDPTIGGVAFPSLIDHSAMLQVQTMLQAAANTGFLAHSFSGALHLHPKHASKRIKHLVAAHGVTKQPEQSGRAKAYRLFAGHVAAGAGSDAGQDAGADGVATLSSKAVAPNALPTAVSASASTTSVAGAAVGEMAISSEVVKTEVGGQGGGGQGGGSSGKTMQSVQRLRWLMDLLRQESVLPVEVLRPFLQLKGKVDTIEPHPTSTLNPCPRPRPRPLPLTPHPHPHPQPSPSALTLTLTLSPQPQPSPSALSLSPQPQPLPLTLSLNL